MSTTWYGHLTYEAVENHQHQHLMKFQAGTVAYSLCTTRVFDKKPILLVQILKISMLQRDEAVGSRALQLAHLPLTLYANRKPTAYNHPTTGGGSLAPNQTTPAPTLQGNTFCEQVEVFS